VFIFIYIGHLNQILSLRNCKEDVGNMVHSVIKKFAERGFQSLAVARQVCLLLFKYPLVICFADFSSADISGITCFAGSS